jgi:glucokinase
LVIDMTKSIAVGLDVGGTKILAGIVSEDGEVLDSQRYAMDRTDQASSLASIHHALDDFLQRLSNGLEPAGIGIGTVGQIDSRNGVWVQAMNIPITTPVPLAEILRVKHGLPVSLDNDVHAATLAELKFGVGKRYDDFIYINVGTGIAIGMVSGRRLIRGAANYAGEVGHMSIEPDGDVCVCGRRGCLESIASGGGMIAYAHSRLPAFPSSTLAPHAVTMTSSLIFTEAEKGDVFALMIRERALQALGTAIVNVANLLNPEAVILGGGVLRDAWIIKRLKVYAGTHCLPAVSRSLIHFDTTDLDTQQVGLLGAASLVKEVKTWN